MSKNIAVNKKLQKVLITVGPTRLYLDPIRYLTNYSTGALGFLLAKKLSQKGFKVWVVCGPCSQPFKKLNLFKVEFVETADEMLKATLRACKTFRPEFAIFSAAVLDFKTKTYSKNKISSKDSWTIRLVPNLKIIDEVGKRYPMIHRIGFKLETEKLDKSRLLEKAKTIMIEKKLFALCVNYFDDISSTKHRAQLFLKNGKIKKLLTKTQIADSIVDIIM